MHPPFPRHSPLVEMSSECRWESLGTTPQTLCPSSQGLCLQSPKLTSGSLTRRRGPEDALAGAEPRVPGSCSAIRISAHPQPRAGSQTTAPRSAPGRLFSPAKTPWLRARLPVAALSQAGRCEDVCRAHPARGPGAPVARLPRPGPRPALPAHNLPGA